jgi:hypothetical protein
VEGAGCAAPNVCMQDRKHLSTSACAELPPNTSCMLLTGAVPVANEKGALAATLIARGSDGAGAG